MLNRETHRLVMFQIIKDIFASKIWKYLALKWWTACYFLYWLNRFSTDLDFDLLENIEVDYSLNNILKKYWSIKNGQKIILSYGEQDINIKIDINRNIWKSNKYEFINFYGNMIQVQEKSTIFANKLVALIERHTNRDIYDVYFFLQNWFNVNEDIIFERTWWSLLSLYKKIIVKLEKFPTNYKILEWLWEILDPKQKIRVKNKLVSELIWIIKISMM